MLFASFTRKIELKEQSEVRVSGWKNTLDSKRKAKLRWKEEVLAREEEKRLEIDKKEEALRDILKRETLQRAKALQYEENERVKLLRSQQLYTEVIATRQLQLKEKEEEVGRKKMEESLWHEKTMKAISRASKEEEEKLTLKKQKAVKIALVMESQKHQADTIARQNKKSRMEEEKALMRKLELDKTKAEQELQKSKEEARTKSKISMEKLAEDTHTKQDQDRLREMEDQDRRQRDIDRSSFVAKARCDLDAKNFQDRQAARMFLSERASQELKNRAAKEVDIFIRDQKAIEDKERARKEEETRKHLELEKAVHESRQKQIALKQERRRKEKEVESSLSKQCNDQCLADLSKEKKNAAERRKKDLEYKGFHEEQIASSIKKEATERTAELEDATKVRNAVHICKCVIIIIFTFRIMKLTALTIGEGSSCSRR